MNDDQLFLANAYLDGELTADERRIAETDPEVMAEVEQLRVVQARLRAIEPPSTTARESAIRAAMAEFNRTVAPAAAPAPARVVTPIRFWQRPAYARYIAIAAAVVAVGTFGVIIAQGGGRGGDNFSAEPAADNAAGTALIESPASAAEGGENVGAQSDGALATPTEATMEEMAAEAADMSEQMASDAAGEEPAADSSDVAVAERAPFATSPTGFDPAEPVTDEFELGAFGRYLLDEQAADRLGPTPNTPCPPEFNILGETTYVPNQDATDVYVAVQEQERRVVALDQSSCEPVGEGQLTAPTDG